MPNEFIVNPAGKLPFNILYTNDFAGNTGSALNSIVAGTLEGYIPCCPAGVIQIGCAINVS
jgi:hypothetical protein